MIINLVIVSCAIFKTILSIQPRGLDVQEIIHQHGNIWHRDRHSFSNAYSLKLHIKISNDYTRISGLSKHDTAKYDKQISISLHHNVIKSFCCFHLALSFISPSEGNVNILDKKDLTKHTISLQDCDVKRNNNQLGCCLKPYQLACIGSTHDQSETYTDTRTYSQCLDFIRLVALDEITRNLLVNINLLFLFFFSFTNPNDLLKYRSFSSTFSSAFSITKKNKRLLSDYNS